MSKKIVVLLVFVSFGLGWFSALVFVVDDAVEPAVVYPQNNRPLAQGSDKGAGSLRSSSQETLPKVSGLTQKSATKISDRDAAGRADKKSFSFTELLNAGKFSQAIDQLGRVRVMDDSEFAQMRQSLLGFLNGLMNSGQDQSFTELTDLYLADYYNDTDVLLLLAEFNKRHAYYFEAVGVFDLADEYGYSIDSKSQVGAAFSRFLADVDDYLITRNDWYRLSQVYLQSEIAGLLNAEQKVRQAAIYLKNGDVYEGKSILEELNSLGTLNTEGEKILAELNASSDQSIAGLSPAANFSSGVPLHRVGNQFLIDVNLDPNQNSVLLIDTGASMTTLSRAGFEKIRYSIDAREIGSRMFSTANGLTKGQVYEVANFTIGQYRLQAVELAVLDFDMNGAAEGLLGMNVLGRFKFQLDQDKPRLLLTPRQ